jgi:hypothetical protein
MSEELRPLVRQSFFGSGATLQRVRMRLPRLSCPPCVRKIAMRPAQTSRTGVRELPLDQLAVSVRALHSLLHSLPSDLRFWSRHFSFRPEHDPALLADTTA